MHVYVVYDKMGDEIITVRKTRTSADRAVLDFLHHAYTPEEWNEFAERHGLSVDAFDDAILNYDVDFEEEFRVEIQCVKVLD